MKGYIHSFESFGAVDGPGVRYIVFMQGCPLRCLYCHNPDSWKLKDGNRLSVRSVVNRIKPYLNYIKTGGVTISGGEPLLQSKFVLKLIKALHRLKLHVALDTAGSLPLEKTSKVFILLAESSISFNKNLSMWFVIPHKTAASIEIAIALTINSLPFKQ